MTNKDKIKKGALYVCETVAKTLGPKGKNVVLKIKNNPAKVTNDGVSIAKAIVLDDEIENVGAELAKQVAIETNRVAGDGTTTSLVLTKGILEQDTGDFDVDTMKEIQEAGEKVIGILETTAKPINSWEMTKQVASVSAESNEIGIMIADVFQEIGKDGVVDVEPSTTKNTYFKVTEGFLLESGYLSHFMQNEGNKAVYKDTVVLVTDYRIEAVEQILPILQQLIKTGATNITIFCAGMSDGVAIVLLQNQKAGAFNSLVVELPKIFMKEHAEDISAITGGTFISKQLGYKLQDTTISSLGRADKIVSDFTTTKIINKNKQSETLASHIEKLKKDDTEDTKKRIAKLNSGVATIYIGASTIAELNYRRDKIEDALNATKCALEEGVIEGAGIALYKIAKNSNIGDTKGATILKKALIEPRIQIAYSMGISLDDLANKHSGIYDPVKVTKTALRNAISLASTVLTTEDVVIEK
jgi:chaperonin GroEL